MAAFTNITAGLDWAHVDFLNELVLAYSERRQAMGAAAVAAVVAGDDIQAVTFWKTMQDWVDAECDQFVDHAETIAGESAVPMFTLSTFREEAGLHADGWRRATEWEPGAVDGTWVNDVSFSYGVMQAGDIIGPWIFDDLQKAFTALKWTARDASSWSADSSTNSYAGYDEHSRVSFPGWPTLESGAEVDFASGGSTSNSAPCRFTTKTDPPGAFATLDASASARKAKAILSGLPTIDRTASVYVVPDRPAAAAVASPTPSYDDFGTGWLEDVLSLVETIASNDTVSVTSDWIGSMAFPPTWCDDPSGPGYSTSLGYTVIECLFILKWEFTNAN